MEVIRAVIEVMFDILLTPGLPFRVGLMVAAAMIVGYYLYDESGVLAKVIAAIIIFVSFEEWARAVILSHIRGFVPNTPIVFAITSTTMFILGISIGAAFAAVVRSRRERERDRVDEIIEEIKTGTLNGNSIS